MRYTRAGSTENVVLAKQTQQQLHLLWDCIVLNVRQWRKFVYETGLNNSVDQAYIGSQNSGYV